MYGSVYDLRAFYNGKMGRVVRRVLKSRIREFWPDVKGLRVMGCGYAVPYLDDFAGQAERCFAMMPAGQGAHNWPEEGKNLVCLTEESEIPLENSSVDRILLLHSLEFSEMPRPFLSEIWRVLKAGGRLLAVVPNRAGFWARTDWSPFGQGTPYSAAQLCAQLRENMFVHERTQEALFLPPLNSSLITRSAPAFEAVGRKILPLMAGVHMVEASKQLYAGINSGAESKVRVRGRGLIAKPFPVPQNFSPRGRFES